MDIIPERVSTSLPMEIAQLFTFSVKNDYDLEIHHMPPHGARMNEDYHNRSRKVILWTMNEHDYLPYGDNLLYVQDIANYDELICYTDQTYDSINTMVDLSNTSTHILQGGIDPSGWVSDIDSVPPRSDLRDNTFRFGTVHSAGGRKNADAVIKAFTQIRDTMDAELAIKVSGPYPSRWDEIKGVKILGGHSWGQEVVKDFYLALDCFVSVSFGEGKNLHAMEAALCGVPTILSDIPGHRGWVHPAVQSLVPTDKYYGVDDADLVEFMNEAYSRKLEAYRRAARLKEIGLKRWTWDYKIEKLGEKIGYPL